ncbi:uncharacterized protein LOC135469068 [Liolophura sinensis]|uniref:uncharacterized protein LOC135469068 n=1 Tax=Liolophura sinensis TaxID=3198878 RepID=UPI0031587AB9
MCNEDCHKPGVLAYRSRQCSGQSLGYTCVKSSHGLGEYDVLPCETTDGYLCRKSWSEWSPWSECEPDCGQRKKTRTRSCMGHGGPCEGSPEQSILCSSGPPCSKIDGQWGKWSMWSQVCSTSCGGGVHTRYRECNNPSPLGAGKPCVGKAMETKPCEKTSVCPVDGSWGKWSAWSCTATCGTSPGTRYRECNNPSPSSTGNECAGKNQETKADVCNYFTCPQNGTAPTLPEELTNELKEDLKKMYNNYDKVEHQSVAFVCGTPVADKIKESYPRTSTFWVKNGQPFKLDPSRMSYDNGDLLIQSVVAADIGVYLCQLEWQPKLRQTVAVYVLVVKSSFKLHTRQHRNLQLYCNGASLGLLYAGLQQIWFHNGEIYKDYGTTPPQTINVEYFEDIGPDFAGLWECTINDPSSMRLWVTNRVNVTVGGGVYFIERLMSNQIYLIGCGAVIVSAVIGIAVCCLYQDKKGDKNAETEAEVYEELMKENPSILNEEIEEEKSRRDEPKPSSAGENYLTESSSFVSDEGLQLKDGGTVHADIR